MDLQQTAALLARIAVVDNRKVDEATVLGWHELVGHLDYADSCEAVTTHRKTSREYLTPIDVAQGVKRIREKRLEGFDANVLDYPGDPDDVRGYLKWRRGTLDLVASGQTPPAPDTAQLVSRPMPALEGLMKRPPRRD